MKRQNKKTHPGDARAALIAADNEIARQNAEYARSFSTPKFTKINDREWSVEYNGEHVGTFKLGGWTFTTTLQWIGTPPTPLDDAINRKHTELNAALEAAIRS